MRPLTGMRGLAAVVVMVGHYRERQPVDNALDLFLSHSWMAVSFFFVLSGFVLAMVYGDGFVERGAATEFRPFVVRRLARLYPLYALTTLACFAMARLGVEVFDGPSSSVGLLAANMALTQEWGWPNDSLNEPAWSISAEWAANLLFPLLAVVLLRWRHRGCWVFLAVAALVFQATEWFSLSDYRGMPILIQAGSFRIAGPLIVDIVDFACGMYFWRLRAQMAWSKQLDRSFLLAVVLGLMVGWMFTDIPDMPFTLLAGVLIIAGSYGQSAVSRVFAWGPVHWLGTMSYSIYLMHGPMWSLVFPVYGGLTRVGLPHAWTVATGMTMVAVIGVSGLTYYLVERPAQRWIMRLGAARPPSGPKLTQVAE